MIKIGNYVFRNSYLQKAKWENMGFMLLNRYLDLADAIDDNGELMDSGEFSNTDIPMDIHLPEKKFLSVY